MQSMLKEKNLRKPWAILLSLMVLFVASCASVKIKDNEFCGDFGEDGATCFTFLTRKQRDIPKQIWDHERYGQICSKPAVFADWKAVIQKLCSSSKYRCTYEEKQQLEEFFQRLEKISPLTN